MVKEEAKGCVFVSSLPIVLLELRHQPVSAAMAAEALQKIVSVALDMTSMLNNMGVPEPKIQQEKPPPALFDIPHPKPLRETLLKLKVHKDTVNRLNQIYTNQVNEYRSKTMKELQLLWSCMNVEGSHTPLRAWNKALLLTQRKTRETLDAWFDIVVDRARDAVTNLSAKKRQSQPVFDQVSIRTYQFSVADWLCSALLISSSGISLVRVAVRTPVGMKRRSSLFPLV